MIIPYEDCSVKARLGAIAIELPELIEAGPTVGSARTPHPAEICDQPASIALNYAPWLPQPQLALHLLGDPS
jgi:hypothetical protein